MHDALVHPCRAPALVRPRHLRIEFDRIPKIRHGLVKLLEREICIAALVKGLRHSIVEFDRAIEIGERRLLVSEIQMQAAAIVVGLKEVFLD